MGKTYLDSATGESVQKGKTSGKYPSKRVLFNTCKSETHLPSDGLKRLHRKLRASFEVAENAEISLEELGDAAVVVFCCPTEKFTSVEFNVLKQFLKKGGSLLFLMAEGGEEKQGTNVNFLLEEFGISFNNDAVVRTAYYKYLHPKQVLVQNGILNREIGAFA